MTISEKDEKFIESGLEDLYKSSLAKSKIDHDQVKQYIYVHEFALALDLLAHIQLKSKEPISLKNRAIFEALALKMGMKDGDEWTGVAKIRAG